ncbi:MAG TPA: SMP-30/gluconolactonase/LRE family protein [Terriglobales bacterium]|nr:SMP-30/gluconolactonase/LRE family protein [Terriglobales bacterium]
MSSCSVLVDDNNLCGEAPLWDATGQKLYWTDCVGRKFYSYDWRLKLKDVLLTDVEVNGCALDRSGDLVFSNNSGVWIWDRVGEPRLLASELGPVKLQLNDCIADPKGRFLAGSCFYDPSTKYELGKLFSLDGSGELQILDEGFRLANGLGFSVDGTTLYFSDSVARKVYAYSYDVATGKARGRRTFIQLDSTEGLPDGLTVDAEDHVWVAQWYGSCVVRYDPDGRPERKISVPAKQSSSVMFGGPGLTELFVTSAARSEPMPVMPSGYDANSGYFGGALFHCTVPVTGKPEYRTDLRGIAAHA